MRRVRSYIRWMPKPNLPGLGGIVPRTVSTVRYTARKILPTQRGRAELHYNNRATIGAGDGVTPRATYVR